MSRVEKVKDAQKLRAQGLLLREIAERMGGVSVKTVSAWLTDPDGSRMAARKNSYQGVCVDCGGPTSGCNGRGPNAPLRCKECFGRLFAQEAALRERAKWAEHRSKIEAMWADGLSIREIRRLAAIPGFSPGPYRQRGYDLPHRYRARAEVVR